MQTKWESFKEQVLNVGSGFILSFLVWEFPLLYAFSKGWLLPTNTLAITMIFTVTSFVRSYLWRRYHNNKENKG